MLEKFGPPPLRWPPRGTWFSVVVHAAIVLAVAVAAHRTPLIARSNLPGTATGLTLLTYYSPGSRQPAKISPSVRTRATSDARVPTRLRIRKALAQPAPAPAPTADTGARSAAQSGAGQGDVSIALAQHVAYPHPDLSTLPHGAGGDIILSAVIDEHGRITALTLLQGLAPSVDETVIATVKEWSFTPATKDGVPVVSEQELHFHYERG